jgi:NIPSNAP
VTWRIWRSADLASGRRGILEVVEIQLRDYRIKPGHMDDWIAGWEVGVVPLRQQVGFEVVGAWVDRAHDRFVWLVAYSGPDGFKAAEERYHALPERLSVHPEPSDFVQAATLDMVDRLL